MCLLNVRLLFDLLGHGGGDGGPGGRPALLEGLLGRELLRRRHYRLPFQAAARQLLHRLRHRLGRLLRLHALGLLLQVRVGRVFGHLRRGKQMRLRNVIWAPRQNTSALQFTYSRYSRVRERYKIIARHILVLVFRCVHLS